MMMVHNIFFSLNRKILCVNINKKERKISSFEYKFPDGTLILGSIQKCHRAGKVTAEVICAEEEAWRVPWTQQCSKSSYLPSDNTPGDIAIICDQKLIIGSGLEDTL